MGKDKIDPNKYIFKRSFEEEKLTVELMSMAHMYRAKDLLMDCTQHLKASVCDDNVMEIWTAAERCENQELCEVAVDHLVKRPRGKTLQDVSGFNEAFKDHDKPMKALLTKLSDKNSQLQEENSNLQEEILQLRKLCQGPFKVTVHYREDADLGGPWTEVFYVRACDKITSLIDKAQNKRGPPEPGYFYGLTKTASVGAEKVKTNRTFFENGIGPDASLYMWLFRP